MAGSRASACPSRPIPRSAFWHGVLEALLVPLAFAGLGLCWYGPLARASAPPPAYPASVTPLPAAETPETPETWLVDGFNVVQVGLLGGRDRSGFWRAQQREALLARAEGFDRPGARLLVVFDGAREAPEGAAGRVRPVFAPSADEWLVARVRRAEAPERLVVVTADRRLAGRVRHHGARVVSPGEFLGRCGPAGSRADPASS